jgi:hypothetical protein
VPVTVVNVYPVTPMVQFTGNNAAEIVAWYNGLHKSGTASVVSQAGGVANIHIVFFEYTNDVTLNTGDWFSPEGDASAMSASVFVTFFRTIA